MYRLHIGATPKTENKKFNLQETQEDNRYTSGYGENTLCPGTNYIYMYVHIDIRSTGHKTHVLHLLLIQGTQTKTSRSNETDNENTNLHVKALHLAFMHVHELGTKIITYTGQTTFTVSTTYI